MFGRHAQQAVFLSILSLLTSSATAALQADDLLLIVNKNIPASVKTAEFYTRARLVPEGRILALNLPASEEIPFDKYEQEFVPAVRDFLRQNHLEHKVRCIVTFFGVPFRIAGKVRNPADDQELAEVRGELDAVITKTAAAVEDAEALAKELNASFAPKSGSSAAPGTRPSPNDLADRANAALNDINRHLPPADDPRHGTLLPRLVKLMQTFGGDSLIASRLSDAEVAAMLPAEQAKRWPVRREEVEAAAHDADRLPEKRWDPEARKTLRRLIAEDFGLFGQLNALHAQIEYLNNDGTAAALDNELALLWWGYYNRSNYLINPLNCRAIHVGDHPPVLMVMRLDGPQEGTATQIILASLKAEREGLKGKFVVDSTGGTGPGGVVDKAGGYRKFDQRLIDLGELVRSKTSMPLTLDRSAQVIAPNSVKDVAVYCGWYSVRNYVPSCRFVAGAVAYHVASFEMVSLRTDNEKGWVAGLLNDGVAATVGAVAEPYLAAFPLPDDFFPLLLTGKLTLAEVYWKTVPMTSWMMACIGDPLYTPFKNDPQMKVADLPAVLRRALEGTDAAAPALAPSPRNLETPPPPL